MHVLTWKLRGILIALSTFMKIVLHVSYQLWSLAAFSYFFKTGDIGMDIVLSGCP